MNTLVEPLLSPSKLSTQKLSTRHRSISLLQNLPPDLFYIILNYTARNLFDLWRLSLVCRSWRNCILPSSLWFSLDDRLYPLNSYLEEVLSPCFLDGMTRSDQYEWARNFYSQSFRQDILRDERYKKLHTIRNNDLENGESSLDPSEMSKAYISCAIKMHKQWKLYARWNPWYKRMSRFLDKYYERLVVIVFSTSCLSFVIITSVLYIVDTSEKSNKRFLINLSYCLFYYVITGYNVLLLARIHKSINLNLIFERNWSLPVENCCILGSIMLFLMGLEALAIELQIIQNNNTNGSWFIPVIPSLVIVFIGVCVLFIPGFFPDTREGLPEESFISVLFNKLLKPGSFLLLNAVIYSTVLMSMYNIYGGGNLSWSFVTIPIMPVILLMICVGLFRIYHSLETIYNFIFAEWIYCVPLFVFQTLLILLSSLFGGFALLLGVGFLLEAFYSERPPVVPVPVSGSIVLGSLQFVLSSFLLERRF